LWNGCCRRAATSFWPTLPTGSAIRHARRWPCLLRQWPAINKPRSSIFSFELTHDDCIRPSVKPPVAVSPKALFNALRLLFRGGPPIALLMLVILSLVHLLYLKDPTRSRIFRYLSVDYMIVLEQLKRATTVVRPDVVLIGDSSCLMDVDAQRLSAGLGRSA